MVFLIGIGFDEDEINKKVTVSMRNGDSMNFIAYGPVDFPSPQVSLTRSTDTTGWIYKAPDNSNFVFRSGSENRPVYDSYIHGWYHPREEMRAVMFIDSELPPGQRCIIMDSFNSMYEYDHRIPDAEEEYIEVIYDSTKEEDADEVIRILPRGKYRIHLKGGTGGSGGKANASIDFNTNDIQNGGQGHEGEIIVEKITLYETQQFSLYNGADGADGLDSKKNIRLYSVPSATIDGGTSAGGGSSGEDTRIVLNNVAIMIARGGAGGGGAYQVAQWGTLDASYYMCSGPGGGGAGYGQGKSGGIARTASHAGAIASRPPVSVSAAQGGNINSGGLGSAGTRANTIHPDNAFNGQNGQNITVGYRRNGGNSPGYTYSNTLVDTVLGGNTTKDSKSGYIKIFKTGEL